MGGLPEAARRTAPLYQTWGGPEDGQRAASLPAKEHMKQSLTARAGAFLPAGNFAGYVCGSPRNQAIRIQFYATSAVSCAGFPALDERGIWPSSQ
jgi:hypothetical protein